MEEKTYFVTGATGFIGRNLVERLLERGGDVHVLVREGSRERLDALIERWGAQGRVHPVTGDLQAVKLGIDQAWIDEHRGKVDHVFHLAAIYDMTAPDEVNEALNVGGTQQLVNLVNDLQPGHLHHVSSVAAAGAYKGLFREDMFDEGQKLPSPYHRTKFESERLVRDETNVPWTVYRPAIVVGDSRTGEMDKVDGPYYFFKAIQKARDTLPQWFPLAGPEVGDTNIVPVDYVADALDALAHQEGHAGQAFHLAAPRMTPSGEALNHFAAAAHAPQLALRVDSKLLDALPKGTFSMLMQLPALKGVRKAVLEDFGIPDEIVGHMGFSCSFDTRDTERALAGTGIEVPELDSYAERIWDYWERNLDPDLFKDRSLSAAVNGRTVVITGASSGIGKAAALKIAKAGGIPLLVARGREKLEETKAEIEAAGGTAYVYTADLAEMDSIEALVEELLAEHASIDMIVNNAGRSIRRSLELSLDRFHDYERTMQLNYFGAIKLVMGLLPHMTERRFGHIVNVSSIGAQTNPPRFSAYVASKAALDAWTRVVSSELIGKNITFTTIHMPLVRTPMIAPTKIYDSFPTISPDEAGDMICEAIRSKPKTINTRLGTFGEVAYALAPKAVDQILHAAYKVFPDSAAAKGQKDPNERASMEQIAMANLMKGVHW
ncbi:MAG: SDR family oxidoreductase [Solirubrobacteraceae bacterium]|jgi:NAD(P)-dependent dehydrogenase (short-subunit alcohol dehydrogenase family)|nr:SDR family oxidoreductase [Solirubrobacteraceae bacterium]